MPATLPAFETIIGHSAQIQDLVSRFDKGQLPHGLGFIGPNGIGKALIAQNLAAYVLGGSHGYSQELALLLAGAHPDFLRISPDTSTAKGDIKVEAARQLVTFMQQTPTRSDWRVAIIDGAQKLNTQAANGILKVLEEPPERGLIILVLDDLSSVLPTIRSRLVPLRFGPLSEPDLTSLAQRLDQPTDPALIQAAGGSAQRLQALSEPETQKALKDLSLISQGKGTPATPLALAKWAASNPDLARDLVLAQIAASARTKGSKALADHYLVSLKKLAEQQAFNLDATAVWLQVFGRAQQLSR